MGKYVVLENTCDVLRPSAVLNKSAFAIFKQLLQASIPSKPLSARRRTVTCGWWFVGGPIVAQLYVRIGFFFIKFVLFYYQEYGNWKITSSIGSYRNKHPQPNTGCVDPEGVRWSGPYPPHPPKKAHVLWVSIEISIPHPPKNHMFYGFL